MKACYFDAVACCLHKFTKYPAFVLVSSTFVYITYIPASVFKTFAFICVTPFLGNGTYKTILVG